MKRAKYNNKKTVIDNIVFDSKKEAARYVELKSLLKAGAISDLELQVRFPLSVNGQKICVYVADFCYKSKGKTIVEDVKGVKTGIYRLKNKMMKAIYGIEIFET